MAIETITKLIDDIDGSEAEETIAFTINGTSYTIDVNAKHSAAFHKALAKFVTHATVLNRDRSEYTAIREWAQANGYEVSNRGRIAQVVVDAYNER